ncbi:hypothetical protein BJP08_07370 [Corynebacterium sp. NML140438]|nr:hypothetical protein BJP08_07370 [Corynebacterium sp. NML140438]
MRNPPSTTAIGIELAEFPRCPLKLDRALQQPRHRLLRLRPEHHRAHPVQTRRQELRQELTRPGDHLS